MQRIGWLLVGVLVIAGVYFLVFHKDLPLNHEAVGLGTLHTLHDVIGIVLIGVAGAFWWRSRRSGQPVAPPGN